MIARTKAASVGLVAVLLFVGSGCSSDAANKAVEKGVEKSTGGDVDIDSEDGTVKFTDEDGNETELNVDGDGASLPKDWPEELAPPAAVKVGTSLTTPQGEMTVIGEAEGTVEDYTAAIKTQLEDGGWEITQDSSTSGVDVAGLAGLTATKGGSELSVTITDSLAKEGSTTIAMTIKPGN